MKLVVKRRPAEYLEPEIGPERAARMWSAVEGAPRGARVRGRHKAFWITSALAAIVALAVFAVARLHVQREPVARTTAGDVVVTQHAASSLRLPDGSSLSLAESTEMSVVRADPDEVRLHVERGSVLCDVVHQGGRAFVVEAGGVLVEVKGTRFAVDVAPNVGLPPVVGVRVERGLVEVRDSTEGLLAVLGPGQSWSQRPPEPQPVASALLPAPKPSPTVGHATVEPDAAFLFDRANAARVAGRPGDAALDYDRLRQRYPGDPRAGLAAFELARIRLDTQRDPRRALEALRFALAHNRGGFVPEDAEALQVDALDRLGDQAACKEAQRAFLDAHLQSAHSRRVLQACQGE